MYLSLGINKTGIFDNPSTDPLLAFLIKDAGIFNKPSILQDVIFALSRLAEDKCGDFMSLLKEMGVLEKITWELNNFDLITEWFPPEKEQDLIKLFPLNKQEDFKKVLLLEKQRLLEEQKPEEEQKLSKAPDSFVNNIGDTTEDSSKKRKPAKFVETFRGPFILEKYLKKK